MSDHPDDSPESRERKPRSPRAEKVAAWVRPIALGLIAGVAAVAVLTLTRPQAPPERVWPEGQPFDPWASAPPGVSSGQRQSTSRPLTRLAAVPITGFTVGSPHFFSGEDADLRRALVRPMGEFTITDLPARAAVEQWRRRTGVNLSVDWQKLTADGFNPDQSVSLNYRNVPAGQVLELLLERVGSAGGGDSLFGFAQGNVVRIEGGKSGARWGKVPVVTRMYDLRPLIMDFARWDSREARRRGALTPDMDAANGLITVIHRILEIYFRSHVRTPDELFVYWGGWLILRDTPEAQEQVAALLDDMTRAALFVARDAGRGR